jgi:hypothetical protein
LQPSRQELRLEGTHKEHQPAPQESGLLTPSTESTLSRYTTPEYEPENPTSGPSANRTSGTTAPRDISSDISQSNVISGSRRRRHAYYAAIEHPQDILGYHTAFATGTHFKKSEPEIPKTLQHQLP